MSGQIFEKLLRLHVQISTLFGSGVRHLDIVLRAHSQFILMLSRFKHNKKSLIERLLSDVQAQSRSAKFPLPYCVWQETSLS